MSTYHARRARLTVHIAPSAPTASNLAKRRTTVMYLRLPSPVLMFAGGFYILQGLFLVHVEQFFFCTPREIQYYPFMTEKKSPIVRLSPELWQELMPRIEQSFSEYSGDSSVLESAWGCLFLALTYGWRVVYLMHSQATIRKYEKIIGYTLREIAPETTALSEKSLAYRFVQAGTNFWRVVRGQEPGIKTTQLQ